MYHWTGGRHAVNCNNAALFLVPPSELLNGKRLASEIYRAFSPEHSAKAVVFHEV